MGHRKEMILSMKKVLINKRDALQKAFGGAGKLPERIRVTAGDSADCAFNSIEDDVNAQLTEVESKELARIDYALEQIKEGKYGICEGCGSLITGARLSALPYATFCIVCQREVERRGADQVEDHWSRLADVSDDDDEPGLSASDLPVQTE